MRRHTKKVPVLLPPTLSIGKAYRVLGYHTGDFVGTVTATTKRTATLRINAPLASTLVAGADIEVPLGLARFGEVGRS